MTQDTNIQLLAQMEAKKFTDMASLAKKMVNVMKTISGVEKKGDNTFQHYKYVRAEDISSEVRLRLAENGLAFYMYPTTPTVEVLQEVPSKEGIKISKVWQQDFVMNLIDQDTGFCLSVPWRGTSLLQNDDKGENKIQTNAKKTFFIHTFVISTDAEKDLEDDKTPSEYAQRPYRNQNNQQQGRTQQDQSNRVPERGATGAGNQQPSQKPPQQPPAQKPPTNITNISEGAQKPTAAPSKGAEDLPETTNITAVKNQANFLLAAATMGVVKDEIRQILSQFNYPKKDGYAAYNVERHDAQLNSLRVWRDLQVKMDPFNPPSFEYVNNWLKGRGFMTPYTDGQIVNVMPVWEQYNDFMIAVHEMTTDDALVRKILKDANLAPWKAENSALALATIKSHLDQGKLNEEVVEQNAKIEEVINDALEEDSEDEPLEGPETVVIGSAEDLENTFDEMFPSLGM